MSFGLLLLFSVKELKAVYRSGLTLSERVAYVDAVGTRSGLTFKIRSGLTTILVMEAAVARLAPLSGLIFLRRMLS